MKLKYKIVTYSPEGLDEELLDKEKDGVKYLSKKAFDKAAEDGLEYRIVGKTRLKEAEEDDKKVLTVGEKRYLLEECRLTRLVGYIPVGDGGFVEYRQTLIPILILLFLLLAAGIGLLAFLLKPEPIPALQPDYELAEPDTNQTPLVEEVTNSRTMVITLPQGDVKFRETFLDFANEQLRIQKKEYAETLYTGSLHLTAYMTKKSEEYLVFDDTVEISEGALPETFIDFLIQKTELVTGIYEGRLLLNYGEAGTLESPLSVIVRNRAGGTMDIGFQDTVYINRSTGDISLYYQSGFTATHDTILQLILDKNEEEYLMAESGIVQPGNAITYMKLLDGAAERLSSGGYSGKLRLYFYSENRNAAATDLNTDIEVKIRVQ